MLNFSIKDTLITPPPRNDKYPVLRLGKIPEVAVDLKGKKFNVIIKSSEQFQSTYVHYYLDDYGDLQIPNWGDDDDRWETDGVVILKHRAAVMSGVKYDELLIHYEDDWCSWEDLCENILDTDDLFSPGEDDSDSSEEEDLPENENCSSSTTLCEDAIKVPPLVELAANILSENLLSVIPPHLWYYFKEKQEEMQMWKKFYQQKEYYIECERFAKLPEDKYVIYCSLCKNKSLSSITKSSCEACSRKICNRCFTSKVIGYYHQEYNSEDIPTKSEKQKLVNCKNCDNNICNVCATFIGGQPYCCTCTAKCKECPVYCIRDTKYRELHKKNSENTTENRKATKCEECNFWFCQRLDHFETHGCKHCESCNKCPNSKLSKCYNCNEYYCEECSYNLYELGISICFECSIICADCGADYYELQPKKSWESASCKLCKEDRCKKCNFNHKCKLSNPQITLE